MCILKRSTTTWRLWISKRVRGVPACVIHYNVTVTPLLHVNEQLRSRQHFGVVHKMLVIVTRRSLPRNVWPRQTTLINSRRACARVTVVVLCVCVCVCLSVTALATSACVYGGYHRHTRVSRRLSLDFDSWIFETP